MNNGEKVGSEGVDEKVKSQIRVKSGGRSVGSRRGKRDESEKLE
jgi:hypothetical protein